MLITDTKCSPCAHQPSEETASNPSSSPRVLLAEVSAAPSPEGNTLDPQVHPQHHTAARGGAGTPGPEG